MKSTATVIGDVVASRTSPDRGALHRRLRAVLAEVNEGRDPVTALRITVGDEYQGTFRTVGAALQASLRLTLALAPEVQVRHGLGWGPVAVLGERPRVEDGPGWWAARAAITEVREVAGHAAQRSLRTAYRRADGVDGPAEAAVDAALALRDELLSGLSEESVMVVRGLLRGRSQRELADQLGVSPSALSQRVRRDGLAVLARTDALLGEVD